MQSKFVPGLAFLVLACVSQFAAAQPASSWLIPQTEAARIGLKRAWFGSVDLQGNRTKLIDVKLDNNTLFVQTSAATTQAIDSETGRVIWVAKVGDSRQPCTPLGVSDARVALVNGTTLYVLDRKTGQVEWTKRLTGTPACGPAINEFAVFCPTMSGRIEVYAIDDATHQNLTNLRINGRTEAQPVSTEMGIAWGTMAGDLAVCKADASEMLFRHATKFPIVASPTGRGREVYFGSGSGYLLAYDKSDGRERWTFAAGSPIVQSPVPIADSVYALCEDLTMFQVSAATGKQTWDAQGIRKFLAASPTRLYTLDSLNRLAILDSQSGARLSTVSLPRYPFAISNSQNDRLILVSDTGLIQSLHEIGREQPLDYRVPKEAPLEMPEKPAPPTPREVPAATGTVPPAVADPKIEETVPPSGETPPATDPATPENDPFKTP
ncbi:MAG: PQQ-binding-like beta-propeller repeat protein [Planctomycetota bacterium]|nr:PQQ-binding-like beta-propeller repeat protein [Planctomycetota bacterium]